MFDLATMQPYSFTHLYDAFARFTDHVVLYLPRTSDVAQIARCVEGEGKVDVVHYCMRGASKALCVYFGEFTIHGEVG